MAAFNSTDHKVVVASSPNLKDTLPVDAKVMLSRLFGDMGIFQVTAGNVAPSNKDVLWWHIDLRTFKRWDAVNGNWFALTSNQFAMHLIRRAILGSVTEITLEGGDLFMFWDISLGEMKIISRNNLAAALLGIRTLTTNEGIQGGGTLAADRTLKLDVNGLTAKTVPVGADLLAVYSVANAAHRKTTIEQIAASFAVSDYLHSEMFFMGSF